MTETFFLILFLLGIGFMLFGRTKGDPLVFFLGSAVLFILSLILYAEGITIFSGGNMFVRTVNNDWGVFALQWILLGISFIGMVESAMVIR